MLKRPSHLIFLCCTLTLYSLYFVLSKDFKSLGAFNAFLYTSFIVSASLLLLSLWNLWGKIKGILLSYSILLVGMQTYFLWHQASFFSYMELCACLAGLYFLDRYIHKYLISSPYWIDPERAVRHQVLVKAQLSNQAESTKVQMLDMSHSGCFITCEQDLILGASYHMKIKIQNFEFQAQTQVVRKSACPQGYGLSFRGLDHRYHKNAETALSQLLVLVGNQSHSDSVA